MINVQKRYLLFNLIWLIPNFILAHMYVISAALSPGYNPISMAFIFGLISNSGNIIYYIARDKANLTYEEESDYKFWLYVWFTFNMFLFIGIYFVFFGN